MKCDVAYAEDSAEALWVKQFANAVSDRQWCSRRSLIDSQLLFGRTLPSGVRNNARRGDGERAGDVWRVVPLDGLFPPTNLLRMLK